MEEKSNDRKEKMNRHDRRAAASQAGRANKGFRNAADDQVAVTAYLKVTKIPGRGGMR
jgi:hypothetical protein